MDQTRPRSGRARLVAAAVGLGLLASVVSVVVLPSPAAAIPPGGYCGNASYYNITDLGRVHSKTEPTQIVQNGNPTPITVTFTSLQSGTVTSSATSSISFTGGINLGIVNSSVSARLSITVSYSVTTTIGISITMSVPSGVTQFGDYGVFLQKTTGTYWSEFWCGITQTGTVTAYSALGQGWKVWQA